MWLTWFPWRALIRKAASASGFLDPIAVLSRLHQFGQPSEVREPIELLRAGVVLHARGLLNTQAIQHNLDWIWPYWVERQFNPEDTSFIPRAFSITHVNLTHRNWTALTVPDSDQYTLIDPRGLVTPLHDSWSFDSWILGDDGTELLPSRQLDVSQSLEITDEASVITRTSLNGFSLRITSKVVLIDQKLISRTEIQASSDRPGKLVVALRPYNPEGVSFIHDIVYDTEKDSWLVNKENIIKLSPSPGSVALSTYRDGDVHRNIIKNTPHSISCSVGMATGAAVYKLIPQTPLSVSVEIPLDRSSNSEQRVPYKSSWRSIISEGCTVTLPDSRWSEIFDQSMYSLLSLSPKEVYPGPYTYKRFWFRDAAFMIHSLLVTGHTERAKRAIECFFSRQLSSGYFRSQEGEWDSNGQVLWILLRYCELTGETPPSKWFDPICRGANWIINKRIKNEKGSLHYGLLPAGFSAEHLGPNDYYYWDDFWGVAGLEAATELMSLYGRSDLSARFLTEAKLFREALIKSLDQVTGLLGQSSIPASPYRRMDSGAIGSIVAGYPLQLFSPTDPNLIGTINFLLEHCTVNGAFFQDMIHSGINPYLTLHLAQVLLRANDDRFFDLMTKVADCATSTGQWPEAIHPFTGGGCMGDGQHGWASAEWIMMVRSCFLREEGKELVVGSGIPKQWLRPNAELSFGPTATPFGPARVTVTVSPEGNPTLQCKGKWRGTPPVIKNALCTINPS